MNGHGSSKLSAQDAHVPVRHFVAGSGRNFGLLLTLIVFQVTLMSQIDQLYKRPLGCADPCPSCFFPPQVGATAVSLLVKLTVFSAYHGFKSTH